MPRPSPLLVLTNGILTLTQRRRAAATVWTHLLDECERDFGVRPAGPEAEALWQALDAYLAEPGLSAMGRYGTVNSHIRPRVRNLAQVTAQHRDTPAIGAEPIEDPIFILGMPRTATTVTHQLLAGAQGCRGPLMAELISSKTVYQDWERDSQAVRQQIRMLDRFEPYYRDIHPLSADDPEETYFAEIATRFFMASAPLPGYREWIDQADPVPWYQFLKQVLQVLQYGRPRHRWVLKQPAHLWYIPTILDVFPSATIVWCHRDPVTVFGSTCSMMEANWRLYLRPKAVDVHQIGALWLDLLAEGIQAARSARVGLPPHSIVDVPYHWLTTNPHATVPGLFDRLDVSWTAADEARLDRHFNNRRGRRHEYQSSHYGKNADQIERAFGDYGPLVNRYNTNPPQWINR